jgi:hypothetical protein
MHDAGDTMKAIVAGLALLLLAVRAVSADPTPEERTAAKANNQKILAQARDAGGVFTLMDNGDVKHVQSGLVCPGFFPNVALWHLEVFSPDSEKGTDVGCDYGRNGADGKWVSKLTIFATKAPAGMTLDQAFANYRKEVMQASPHAASQGAALRVEDQSAPDSPNRMPEIRSEEFVTDRDGQRYTDDLIVALQGGWILEIRTTYLGLPNTVEMDKGDDAVSKAAAELGDRVMDSTALVSAAGTMGR